MAVRSVILRCAVAAAAVLVAVLCVLCAPGPLLTPEHTTDAPDPSALSWPADLNTVSFDTLLLLDGMSETLAGRVIAYREEHGGFQSVSQLREIEGIGDTRYRRWSPYFTVT